MSTINKWPEPSPDRATGTWMIMRERWNSGQIVRVEEFLDQESYPSQDPDLVLDLIYGELALREQHGEKPTLEEFIQRFPHLADRIKRQFEIHSALSTIANIESSTTHWNESNPGPLTVDEIPQKIGKYRVISHLGTGGQATVYRAIHPELGQDVVIKLSQPNTLSSKNERENLVKEGRILAELRHPNLARVYDLDQQGEQVFVVMEYIAGRSLAESYRFNRPTHKETAKILAALAQAIAHVHAHGIFHLDLKPENILLGENGTPRVIDFGIGQRHLPWLEPFSAPKGISGTLSYLPPERARHDQWPSLELQDIFGLGGILYFLMTGKAPYAGNSASEVWENVGTGSWDRDLLGKSGFPKILQMICAKCLSPEPGARYPTANALANSLEPIARGPQMSRRVALLGGSGALLAALGYGFWNREQPAPISSPQLQLKVWKGNRFGTLTHSLPLQTGDKIRVESESIPGLHMALLWVDPKGVVHELASSKPSTKKEDFSYPEPGNAVPLEGESGTEVILLCGRRGKPVDIEGSRKTLRQVMKWPLLPGFSIVRLNLDEITVENHGRGPGKPESLRDPETEIASRMRQLAKDLHENCTVLAGLAFAHG